MARWRAVSLEPGEFITGISGRYGSYVGFLNIVTNLRTLPFGSGGGAVQRSSVQLYCVGSSEIIGFCGQSGDYMDAVGVVLRHR